MSSLRRYCKSRLRRIGLRRLRLRRHWPALLILGLYLFLASTASVVNPLFESTDEIRHYRFVRYLIIHRALPVQGEEQVRSQSHHPPLYYLISALASGWVTSAHTAEYEHPTNPFWGYRNWEVGVDNKLQYYHFPAEDPPFREGYLAAMIPRWINVLLGGVTVWLTYRLGLKVWPERRPLAWGAAALIAFNPQFIYLSGAMNNDIIAAATGGAVALVTLYVVRDGLSVRRLASLGLVYGLALLAKLHLLAFGGIIGLALALRIWWAPTLEGGGGRTPIGKRGAALRQWLKGMGIVLGVAALVAGWWFVRNWWLYGDPTGVSKVNELWAGRSASGSWWALRQGLPYLWSSLWGRFGYGQIPLPQPIYGGVLLACGLMLTGYLFAARRKPRGRTDFFRVAVLFLGGVTVAGFLLVVFYYILIQPAGPMGRFLFPALPALALLLMGGLDSWPLLRERPAVSGLGVAVGMALLASIALAGFLLPAVSYPAPAPPTLPGQPLEVQVGDVAQIHAVEVRPARIRPGEPLFVTVVWEPLRRTQLPYTVYVHVIDEVDVLISQRDTWPGLGRAPTTTWQPGHAFVDTVRVDLPETAYAPDQAMVRVGLYEPTLGRLPIFNRAGESLGDGITAGTVAVAPRPGPWPNAQQANFGDEITLVGYRMEPRAVSAGETFTLTLYWQPRPGQAAEYDYRVFAQVIDDKWRVWGSRDGHGPGWASGQVSEDVRVIRVLPETPAGSYPVQVGLFHPDTGRLPVVAADGHYLDERVLLGPVRVKD